MSTSWTHVLSMGKWGCSPHTCLFQESPFIQLDFVETWLLAKHYSYRSDSSAILSYINLKTPCLAFADAVCLSGCPSSARWSEEETGHQLSAPKGPTWPPGHIHAGTWFFSGGFLSMNPCSSYTTKHCSSMWNYGTRASSTIRDPNKTIYKANSLAGLIQLL